MAKMRLKTRFAIEMDDIALLRNDWRFNFTDPQLASSAAEVVRRQSDEPGSTSSTIPFGSSDMIP
jgi:hypothetical protein